MAGDPTNSATNRVAGRVVLSRRTRSVATARRWLAGGSGDLDGVIAKRLDLSYRSGERDGMVKVKRQRTADCVVGGFHAAKAGGIGSLLLGLYDDDGLLHHVGFTSSLRADQRKGLVERGRWRTITSRAAGSAMVPGFCAGARTRRQCRMSQLR
jgi:ATP-dependent DNA ligase